MDRARLDAIIDDLLSLRRERPGTDAKLRLEDMYDLSYAARNIFSTQPMLLELSAPVKICGDIHGQFSDLLRMFEHCGYPPDVNYLFLGDYVDRGKQSLETVCLLFAYKIKYPENFFLLRGNHETEDISKMYGFFDECKRRYEMKLWKHFCDTFAWLPVAGVVENRILCMHGGLSPEMNRITEIKSLPRPTSDVGNHGLMCDLMWSDPQGDITGWGENDRGVSFVFGPDVVASFVKRNDLDLICRAHQVVQDGYEFFASRQLVTIFSAPSYCGEFDNSAGVLTVDEKLLCSFQIVDPLFDKKRRQDGKGDSPYKRPAYNSRLSKS
ncbi:hypothetical protein AeMF1_002882 [Aphanomyces euteiches]|nr:hypothetical protein AeMF1_002882 [Aphanomyces euteiches]KAH9185648.1 hypothetical protein AeNC1_012375 [Aphanomyces euteiches]